MVVESLKGSDCPFQELGHCSVVLPSCAGLPSPDEGLSDEELAQKFQDLRAGLGPYMLRPASADGWIMWSVLCQEPAPFVPKSPLNRCSCLKAQRETASQSILSAPVQALEREDAVHAGSAAAVGKRVLSTPKS